MTIYDIGFDSTHDMYLDGSDMAFADEDNIVEQRLTIRLQFLLSEWFIDNTKGLPYTQFIFEQGSDLEDIYSLFRTEILETEGVDSLESLDLTPDTDNKSLRADFTVNEGTISGTAEVTI